MNLNLIGSLLFTASEALGVAPTAIAEEQSTARPLFIAIDDDFEIIQRGNTIRFTGDISQESIDIAMRYLRNLVSADPEASYEVIFDTPGGHVDPGYELLNLVGSIAGDIAVRCDGEVKSMGFMSFINENFAYSIADENCEGMFHFSYYHHSFDEEQLDQGAPNIGYSLNLSDYQNYLAQMNANNTDEHQISFNESYVTLTKEYILHSIGEIEGGNHTQDGLETTLHFGITESADFIPRRVVMSLEELYEHLGIIENQGGADEIVITLPAPTVTLTRDQVERRIERLLEDRERFVHEFSEASILTPEDVLSFAETDVFLSAVQMYVLGLVDIYEGNITPEDELNAMQEFCDDYGAGVDICQP